MKDAHARRRLVYTFAISPPAVTLVVSLLVLPHLLTQRNMALWE
jgi:hypothetical protein